MPIDPDQQLLDTASARLDAEEAELWRCRKAEHARLESAARAAHKLRQANSLIMSRPVVGWDDLCLASKEHLIADAANVAVNPEITAPELHRLYQERLRAHRDTENQDISLAPDDIEDLVLRRLKELLAGPQQPTP
jgi:hypothetical protein